MNATTVASHFADKLSRAGLMTQEDSDMLCAISVRGKGTRGPIWTAAQDRHLMRLLRTMRAPQVAQKIGRTAWAVRSRVRTLKAKEGARGAR